jgi:2-polyprenyl-3-methyl-5-hydroxy-6-metoxy-1,4-benzoquinol methylase
MSNELKKRVEEEVQRRTYTKTKYSDWQDDILAQVKGLVLDLGAGDGAFTVPMVESGLPVVASDLSHLRLVKLKAHTSRLAECDASNLPFKKQSFDSVLFIEVLEHLPDHETQKAALREFARVLKPSGRLILSTPNRPVYRVMTWFWRWLGGQKPDPTHYSELSWSELVNLCEDGWDIKYSRGKAGLIPLKSVQKYFSRKINWCYDILVVLETKK